MGPVGRVPSNFGDNGDNWSPPTFATGCHVSLSTVGSRPDFLAKLKRRRKDLSVWKGVGETWVGQ